MDDVQKRLAELEAGLAGGEVAQSTPNDVAAPAATSTQPQKTPAKFVFWQPLKQILYVVGGIVGVLIALRLFRFVIGLLGLVVVAAIIYGLWKLFWEPDPKPPQP